MTELAVVTADTHLAQRSWVKHPGLEGDAYYGLAQVVDYCILRGLPLILAGDVFDKQRPDPTTIARTVAQLTRMQKAGLKVYDIQGQHELDRNQPWLQAISEWPIHVDKVAFQIGAIKFYGIDWQPADTIQEEFAKIPSDTDVLIAHQVWRDLMGPRIGESECQFADVPHVKVIATGDFHRHMWMPAKNRNGDTILILSPGPVCMQSIDEDPRKFFFVLNDDLSVTDHELVTRGCYRFDITSKDDLEVFLKSHVQMICAPQEQVPQNIARNIVHIVYQDSIPELYSRVMAAIGSKAHVFMSPVKQKAEVITVETERRRALADGGLEACLELVTPRGGTLYRDVLTLLRSPDPKAQLDALHERFVQTQVQKP
jgi:hypothetical protein